MKCNECKKEIPSEQNYKCRICYLNYCSKCALDHFGLKEGKGRVYPKNILYSMWWIIKKRFFQKG